MHEPEEVTEATV